MKDKNIYIAGKKAQKIYYQAKTDRMFIEELKIFRNIHLSLIGKHDVHNVTSARQLLIHKQRHLCFTSKATSTQHKSAN